MRGKIPVKKKFYKSYNLLRGYLDRLLPLNTYETT